MTDRTVLTRLKLNVSDFVKGTREAGLAVKALTSEIDTSSDRTAYLAQGLLALGPTIAPLGAAAIPVFTGLATQLTVAGVAAASAGLAFNGVGDALKALNDYQIDPTDAHLKKLNQTMAKVGPAGREFVHFLDDISPKLSDLANTARAGLFPGVEGGILHLLDLLPQVKRIVKETSETLGNLADAGGAGLAGPRFAEFFQFLETDAQPILVQMGRTIGNFTDGLAAMLVAFEPLSVNFSTGFEHMSKSFADWAHGLQGSQSFQDFINYIEETGPKVGDLLAAIGDALVAILRAAAPVGDIMLPAFTELFKVIDLIASSPLGPVFIAAGAAIGIYGRAVAIAEVSTGGFFGRLINSETGLKAQGKAALAAAGDLRVYESRVQRLSRIIDGNTGVQTRANRGISEFARTAGPLAATAGLLALNLSGVSDKIGLSNTASLGFAGSLIAPGGLGVALGLASGFALDFAHANDQVTSALHQADAAAKSSSINQVRAAQAALVAQAAQLAHGNTFQANLRRISAFMQGDEHSLVEASYELNRQADLLLHGPLKGIGSLLTQNLGTPARQAALDIDGARQASARFASALDGLGQKLTLSQTRIQFRSALRGLGQVVKDNPLGTGLDTGLGKAGAQGDAVREQLLNIIQLTLQTAAGLNSVDQIGFLRKARSDIIQRATDLGIPLKVVRNLLDSFGVLDRTSVTPKVGLDTGEFDTKKKHVQTFLDYLDKHKYFEPTITFKARVNDPVLNTVLGLLDGGKKKPDGTTDLGALLFAPTSGKGHAAGGWTGPGSKYTPAGFVHADEFVFSKEATHGNVGFLTALHQEMRGYAAGGYVNAAPVTPVIDMDALREIASMMRPVVGTQHIQPHDYNEFRRQQDQTQRMASVGGRPAGGRR